MSAVQLGSPFTPIVVERDTTRFFGQLNVARQRPEIASSSVRSLSEHQCFVVAKLVFFHSLVTVLNEVQSSAYKMQNLS